MIDQGFWRVLDRAARHATPAFSIVAVIVFLALPDLLPVQPMLRTAIVASSIYFWSLYRPASLPAPVVALIGALLDLLGNSPLGLWAILLLLEQAVILHFRRSLIAQGFFLIWLIFAGVSACLSALEWLGRSLLDLSLLPVQPIVIQIGVMILMYPLLAILLVHVHRGPAAPELA
jgi:rod shape-determining protein MreD